MILFLSLWFLAGAWGAFLIFKDSSYITLGEIFVIMFIVVTGVLALISVGIIWLIENSDQVIIDFRNKKE